MQEHLISQHFLIGVTFIVILGIGAQWLAWRLRLPAILLLLICGFAAGPLTGLIDTNELFGELLLPIVSISVAIILYEGGLSLRFSEIRDVGGVVRNLVSIGILISWVMIAGCAYYILKLEIPLAILIGAILVVTGPTVIVPLLRHVRPAGRIGPVLKWEGIINDPVGVIIAVLVFEAILALERGNAAAVIATGIVQATVIGTVTGILGAAIIIVLFKRYWVPDFLQNPFSLMVVIGTYTLANYFQSESGLLSVTLMGIILANQKWINVKHIVEFKENLRVLLISTLFIILSAHLTIDNLKHMLDGKNFVFLAAAIFLVRPLAVFISASISNLDWKEKLFLSWMAPRGIVAAAVSSIFAFRLEESGFTQADLMVPVTFLVITGTVAVYGLTASPLATWLGLANPNPQGVLIIGADKLARTVAKAIDNEGVPVLLTDSNRAYITHAKNEGLRTHYANFLSERVLDEIDLDGIGRLLALTPNEELNSLSALHFLDVFGRSGVYQLSIAVNSEEEEKLPKHLRGRTLFGENITYSKLWKLIESDAVIERRQLKDESDFKNILSLYGDSGIPLFLIDDDKTLTVFAADNPPTPKPGQVLVSLANPGDRNE
jgi:NhaP-type Na+/H+ or K+/H+ antiporter